MSAAVPALPPNSPRPPFLHDPVRATRLGRQPVETHTSRGSLRPADAEQLRRALADHKRTCRACIFGQRCDEARRLAKALNR